MSFLLKGEKEDLLELATELGFEATVDKTKPMLKNLITKNAGYDEEDTKLMYEGIVEERKERELLEERKRRDKKTSNRSSDRSKSGSRNNRAPSNEKFDNHNTRRTGNFNPERRYLDTNLSRDFDRRAPRKCYICHSLDHLSFNCPRARKVIKREQPNSQVQSCSVTPQKGLHLKIIVRQ
ncbi:hypothetical protein TNIN_431101 [Trichonephila inaurata madagascariensis]|uniref:CCHC-type domain-containing protein n=1 Tax=Trichonephila inaurata madagascariensis TaxID=2747483 RepID=A0A8X6J738_9ARAC|nr:hypothetical protein TNIN_431101 [Trichonephila inaurata madagascariensis]